MMEKSVLIGALVLVTWHLCNPTWIECLPVKQPIKLMNATRKIRPKAQVQEENHKLILLQVNSNDSSSHPLAMKLNGSIVFRKEWPVSRLIAGAGAAHSQETIKEDHEKKLRSMAKIPIIFVVSLSLQLHYFMIRHFLL